MTRLALGTATALFLLAAPATAHPGHGDPAAAWSLAHHLAEPLHVALGLALAAGVLGTLAGVRRLRTGRARR